MLEKLFLRFSVPVVESVVDPMSVGINVELLKVSEFVERVVLQVVSSFSNDKTIIDYY